MLPLAGAAATISGWIAQERTDNARFRAARHAASGPAAD